MAGRFLPAPRQAARRNDKSGTRFLEVRLGLAAFAVANHQRRLMTPPIALTGLALRSALWIALRPLRKWLQTNRKSVQSARTR